MTAARSTAQMQTHLMMQYIGVVSLLGRIGQHLPKGHEDRYGLDKAMRDANNLFLVGEVNIFMQPASNGGYAAFERDQIIKSMAGVKP